MPSLAGFRLPAWALRRPAQLLVVALITAGATAVVAQPSHAHGYECSIDNSDDSNTVRSSARAAAATLPAHPRSAMERKEEYITNDFASRNMYFSGAYIAAVVDLAEDYGFVWDCQSHSFKLWDDWPPYARMAAPTSDRTLSSSITARWTGSDLGHGIASAAVRVRTAAFNGTYGAWQYPAAWQRTTAASVSPDNNYGAWNYPWEQTFAGSTTLNGARPGSTYCFSVRATDKAGGTSAWSPQDCITRALDDRSLTGRRWQRLSGSSYYNSTISQTTSKGATLKRTGVQARRIGLIATKRPGGGRVAVYLNGTLLTTVNLNASTTRPRAYFLVMSSPSLQTGTVTLKATTSGKKVQIDGLDIAREP